MGAKHSGKSTLVDQLLTQRGVKMKKVVSQRAETALTMDQQVRVDVIQVDQTHSELDDVLDLIANYQDEDAIFDGVVDQVINIWKDRDRHPGRDLLAEVVKRLRTGLVVVLHHHNFSQLSSHEDFCDRQEYFDAYLTDAVDFLETFEIPFIELPEKSIQERTTKVFNEIFKRRCDLC